MKMKIVSFCAAVLLFAGLNSNAQESGAQLRGGVNLANISVTDDGRVDEANMLTSFHVGIVGDVPLTDILYFQPGIIFTGKGSKTETGNPNGLTYKNETFNPFYIELPANFVFKAPIGATSLFFGAGPYLGIGIAGKTKLDGKIGGFAVNGENNIEYSNDDPTTGNQEEGASFRRVKRFDYGVNGTAGIEGKTVILGVNYGYGLAKIPSGTNSSAGDNNKHRVLSFSIGFKL